MFKQGVRVVLAAALMGAVTASHAMPHRAQSCRVQVSDLDLDGKPLTYALALRLRGATVTDAGRVYTPVRLPNGRSVVYAIERSGCARQTLHSAAVR